LEYLFLSLEALELLHLEVVVFFVGHNRHNGHNCACECYKRRDICLVAIETIRGLDSIRGKGNMHIYIQLPQLDSLEMTGIDHYTPIASNRIA
jgi:hypothetical protein